jgi:hypothetical protein
MSDSFCPACGECMLYKAENHQCPPVWEVVIENYNEADNEGMEVMAWDAEEAAEKAVEMWDRESDYSCVGGDRIKVTVKEHEGKEVKEFIVTGEATPTYHASEISPEE